MHNDVTSSRYKWTVPITYITNKNKEPTLVWFDKSASEGTDLRYIITICERYFAFFFLQDLVFYSVDRHRSRYRVD